MLPRILIAYANDQAHGLRHLAKEAGAVQQALWGATCEVILLPAADLDAIFDAFDKYGNSIKIFHYAGHAGEYGMELRDRFDQQQRVGGPGFAAYLANTNKDLQLVFLNGCSTRSQAHELIEQGIPQVIATAEDIPDHAAQLFAAGFYKSLAAGYTIPRAFSEAKSKSGATPGAQDGNGTDSFRSVGFIPTTDSNRLYWELWPETEVRSHWKLESRRTERNEQLPARWHLNCNREDQSQSFLALLAQRALTTPKVCILTGNLNSRHRSLLERFDQIVQEKKQDHRYGGLKQIEAWPGEIAGVSRRETLQQYSLSAFPEVRAFQNQITLETANDLVDKLQARSIYLAYQEIDCNNWKPEKAAQNLGDLEWYIRHFWNVKIREAERQDKKLFVFLNVILPEKRIYGSLLDRLRGKDQLETFLEKMNAAGEVRELPNVVVFPKLGLVGLHHVRKFLDKVPYFQQRKEKVEQYLQTLFQDHQQGWEMWDIEKKLEEIAKEVNQQP